MIWEGLGVVRGVDSRGMLRSVGGAMRVVCGSKLHRYGEEEFLRPVTVVIVAYGSSICYMMLRNMLRGTTYIVPRDKTHCSEEQHSSLQGVIRIIVMREKMVTC